MSNPSYVGSELELFSHAANWKSYWSSHLQDHIKGSVLEVGAGIGSNTKFLISDLCHKWVCLEPDNNLAAQLKENLSEHTFNNKFEIIVGSISSLSSQQMFDTIIYIDVLEHIKDDREELEKASEHLNPDGKLLVLSPAHQFLYSKFDEAIGHFRRYDKNSLKNIIPSSLTLHSLIYLDSIGLLASLSNRLFLKQSNPGLKQILTWDHVIIPCSKWVDYLIRYKAGKSILSIMTLNR